MGYRHCFLLVDPVRVAVVGSRKGAVLEDVEAFCRKLHEKHPDTVLVSGGADGVDRTAEQSWLEMGGRVISFRPSKIGDGEFVIDRWMLDASESQATPLTEAACPVKVGDGQSSSGESFAGCALGLGKTTGAPSSRIDTLSVPTWADYGSAALYRDMLIAELCDRLVAFQREGGSRGTAFTVECARNAGKPVYLYSPKERFCEA